MAFLRLIGWRGSSSRRHLAFAQPITTFAAFRTGWRTHASGGVGATQPGLMTHELSIDKTWRWAARARTLPTRPRCMRRIICWQPR